MLLLVDNYDSFTYNLVDYFNQLEEECHVVKNDLHPSELIEPEQYSGLVLSPGPGRPESAGYLLEYVKWFEDKLPILGICLGHQAIALHFGAKVEKAIKPMHGKISVIKAILSDDIFHEMPEEFNVVRYHSLAVKFQQPNALIALASTKQGENMILRHLSKLIYGMQYHPEAILTQHGLKILNNWLLMAKQNHLSAKSMLLQ